MTGPQYAAGFVVFVSGAWLVGLAALSMFAPQRAAQLLSGFAGSARAHYLEQALRIVAGVGFILYSSAMRLPTVFLVFGWVLVLTSAGLLAVPWQLHGRFANWVVPFVIRHLKLYAGGALLLAAAIFYAML